MPQISACVVSTLRKSEKLLLPTDIGLTHGPCNAVTHGISLHVTRTQAFSLQSLLRQSMLHAFVVLVGLHTAGAGRKEGETFETGHAICRYLLLLVGWPISIAHIPCFPLKYNNDFPPFRQSVWRRGYVSNATVVVKYDTWWPAPKRGVSAQMEQGNVKTI